jgi:hypothetical protein
MLRKGKVDPRKLPVVINTIISMPILDLFCAMKVAKFTKEEIADLTLRRYLQ